MYSSTVNLVSPPYLTGVSSVVRLTPTIFTSHKVDRAEKLTWTGKKSSPSHAGVTNSMLPFRFESSIKSMVHTSSFRLESTVKSPSQLLTVGGSREEGNGMTMETFSYSMPSEASYSIETKDSPPDTDGQQLITIGTLLSSLVWKRHFKIPSGLPHGNGRFGSFNPKIPSLACNCLSMFGCVLNWYPSFAPVSIATFTNASSSFWISIIIVPCTSMLSKPPSLDK